MLSEKNILITGGAGFIGSHLFEKLIERNNYVVVIDNFNDYYPGKEQRFEELSKEYDQENYKLIKGNLLNKRVYSKIKMDIEIIFHLAAQAGVRYSIQHPSEVSNNNIVSTVNILDYARKNQVKRFIFASSSSVYGNPKYTPLDENHPKNPISPYAVSKLSCENYLDYYYREYNLPATALRFYTVYGPRGRPDMAIRKFFNLMMQDKEIMIYGDGEQKRDFTYVSDIIEGLILAAKSENSIGQVFNLGVSDPVSVNELIDLMYSITNKPRKVKYVEERKGDVAITYSDTTKANKILNYNPKVKIEEGLKRTYEWQKRFEKGKDKLKI